MIFSRKSRVGFAIEKNYYSTSTDGTIAELKTDIIKLLQTLIRGLARALTLYI